MQTNPLDQTNVNEKIAELADDRLEAIGRANMEAEAVAAASIREEADRLLQEHRDRTAKLQEEMKVRGSGNAGLMPTRHVIVVARLVSCARPP